MSLVSLYKNNKHTTDKHGVHTYLKVYDKLFRRLKDGKNKILEIGVYRGDSLNLWAEYFTKSVIYGIDKNTFQICLKLHKNIKILKLDAYNIVTVGRFRRAKKFNIIIDDGDHVIENQKFVIRHYCDLLTDDGILIIEDITIGRKNNQCISNIHKLVRSFPKTLRKYVYWVDMRRENLENNFLLICDKSKEV